MEFIGGFELLKLLLRKERLKKKQNNFCTCLCSSDLDQEFSTKIGIVFTEIGKIGIV